MTELEGRTQPRHAAREPLCFVSESEVLGRWPATVRNISEKGVTLILSRTFAPGTLLCLEIACERHYPGLTKLLRVIHAESGGNTCWQIGGAFTRPLTPPEFDCLKEVAEDANTRLGCSETAPARESKATAES